MMDVSPLSMLGLSLPPDTAIPNPILESCDTETKYEEKEIALKLKALLMSLALIKSELTDIKTVKQEDITIQINRNGKASRLCHGPAVRQDLCFRQYLNTLPVLISCLNPLQGGINTKPSSGLHSISALLSTNRLMVCNKENAFY